MSAVSTVPPRHWLIERFQHTRNWLRMGVDYSWWRSLVNSNYSSSQEAVAVCKLLVMLYGWLAINQMSHLTVYDIQCVRACVWLAIQDQNQRNCHLRNAAYFHCLHVHMQVVQRHSFMTEQINATEWGWVTEVANWLSGHRFWTSTSRTVESYQMQLKFLSYLEQLLAVVALIVCIVCLLWVIVTVIAVWTVNRGCQNSSTGSPI